MVALELWIWFKDWGAIRLFYLLIGFSFGYVLFLRTKDYEQVVQQNVELVRHEAVLEYKIEFLTKQLIENANFDKDEKARIDSMSTDDRLEYLASPGAVFTITGQVPNN